MCRWAAIALLAGLSQSGCMLTGQPVRDSAGATPVGTDAGPVAATATADAAEPPPAPTETPGVVVETDLWERLTLGFELQHIQHPRIEREIHRLQRSPKAFHALMARGEPYLHHIVERIEDAGLPGELALLPAVESGFRSHVYSPDGAAGLWQFMPATGHMLGLEQDWWFDKRRSVGPATDAAITYLQQLNRRFDGDWLHTLAAYNAGAATVNRALRRADRRGDNRDFWSLDLPGETDRYVPRLLAIAAIVRDPERYAVRLPDIPNRPHFAVVPTNGQIDLNIAARLAGMTIDELLALNAGHKRWASRPRGPHQLLLPVDRVGTFEAALANLPESGRLHWRRHRIVSGDSLNGIARQYGVTAQAIRETNGLKDSRIRAGRDLLIPVSESVTAATAGANQQARQRLNYRVRRGDSLYTIARRFQVSIADLKRWNRVGRYIQPGERLTLYIDPDA